MIKTYNIFSRSNKVLMIIFLDDVNRIILCVRYEIMSSYISDMIEYERLFVMKVLRKNTDRIVDVAKIMIFVACHICFSARLYWNEMIWRYH